MNATRYGRSSVAEQTALRILAGCEQGSTEAALAASGVNRKTLDALVRAGQVRTWTEQLAKPRIEVRWFALDGGE